MRHLTIQILLLLVLLISGSSCGKQKGMTIGKPNIVIILTDDLGYGDVSKYNPDSKIQTPFMDALAEEGIWCTDAHSTCAVCSPSRYSLLTGRYPWRGKLKKGIVGVCEESVIEDDLYTLPQMLKDNGYHTACIGKWHLGFDWPWKDGVYPPKNVRNHQLNNELFDWSKPIKGGPLAIGFDHYFGDDVPNFPPYAFIEDSALTCKPVQINKDDLMATCIGVAGTFHGNGPGQEEWQIDQVMPTITEKAVKYVIDQSKKDEPFFLYFSTTSPHTPVVPVPEFQGKSLAGTYGDYVVQTDDAIGQLIKSLKDNSCFENTLLIVTSDNGPSPKIVDIIRDYGHLPASHLRGMKAHTWEGGHRIPFIVSWPAGGLKGGKTSDALISLSDIFSTVAGILGVELPAGSAADSYDILQCLTKNLEVRKEMVYMNYAGDLGLRQDNWVLLEGSGGRPEPDWKLELFKIQSPDAPVQLFNLNNDPGQKVNIHENHPKKVEAMHNRLMEIKQ